MTSSLVKIIAESPHMGQEIIIHSNPYIILHILNQYRDFHCWDQAIPQAFDFYKEILLL